MESYDQNLNVSFDDEEGAWLLALETALIDCVDINDLIGLTRGRILPEEHRAQIWHMCLGGGCKINNFEQFDEIFDLPEQRTIRTDSRALVDKLGNEEEDKVSIVCDVESIFTHYCKTRNLQYSSDLGWSDIITPLLAVKMPKDHIYMCFEEILEKYIPRETSKGAPVYHMLRLLILYHDPELLTFLDSHNISPCSFAKSWMESLFASVCGLDATTSVWDIYLQERDPYFILFLSLVILVNARDSIMGMSKNNREEILKALTSMPAALTTDDVPDFCSLARYYILNTPITFREEFCTLIFGSVYMTRKDNDNIVTNLPLSQALCLVVSPEEIIQTTSMAQSGYQQNDQVVFFLVDCRPLDQYNAGHLLNAFHLDSSLMLQQPASFQTAVQGLLMAQRQAISTNTPGCGKHLCFIGSGREQEDQYVYMVVASFLQKNISYVSIAKGGYQALHDYLDCSLEDNLTDHDSKNCLVCSPDNHGNNSDNAGDQDHFISEGSLNNSTQNSSTIMNKFSLFSTAFKSKSAEMKDRLVEYINNPNMEATSTEKHVSSADRGKKLYRNQGDIFTLQEDDSNSNLDSINDNESMEVVKISDWTKKPDVITTFSCKQVKENGYMYPCHLILMETLLFVIREIKNKPNEGHLAATRTLSSIVKITSKKKHPDLITFKYGETLPDGEITIYDIDRFFIPSASEATKVIKTHIMKQIELSKS